MELYLTLTDAHADCSKEEKVTTAELLNHVETRESGGDIDRVCNDLNDEGALETSAQEVLSAVVDYYSVSRRCRVWGDFDIQMKLTPVSC